MQLVGKGRSSMAAIFCRIAQTAAVGGEKNSSFLELGLCCPSSKREKAMKAKIFALALVAAAGVGLSCCASGGYCDPVYGCGYGYCSGYAYGPGYTYGPGYFYGGYPGTYYGSGSYYGGGYGWRRGGWARGGMYRGGWARGGYY
jgi:hypothetical protein